MALPPIREFHKFDASAVYKCTNEEPDLWSKVLGKRQFGKVAGILSGGEIVFSVLLPRCREAVVVDHAYGSMLYAYAKMALMDSMGIKALKELLAEGTDVQMAEAFINAANTLPDALKNMMRTHMSNTSNMIYDIGTIRKEWHLMSSKTLEIAKAKLDAGKMMVIHGDLMDLKPMGPFPLLYVSNAMGHYNRDRNMPNFQQFGQLVHKGGYVLAAFDSKPTEKEGWEIVKSLRGIRTTWYHTLMRKK